MELAFLSLSLTPIAICLNNLLDKIFIEMTLRIASENIWYLNLDTGQVI